MAWEWVAPVATATVGIAGIIFTWLTGKQARDDARATAWEARYQQRLEVAYLELLKMAERAGQWAQFVYPVYQSGPPPETQLPTFEVQADTAALLKAFGSDAVQERRETWESVVRQMISAAEQVVWEEAHPSQVPPQGKSARVTIHELRPKEREAREALGNQVAAELKHRT
ncbi:hypothetical protein [Mycobacterium avium]|uniref:hypothetical protein n=1 Tax=Mycobacterium avium TaxID=1764 RepID=UPI000A01BEE8|nr:hypothetical protein [Mycobacterium avium]